MEWLFYISNWDELSPSHATELRLPIRHTVSRSKTIMAVTTDMVLSSVSSQIVNGLYIEKLAKKIHGS
jgi:hypothetical protein